MIPQQNRKSKTSFSNIVGVGTIMMCDGSTRDVQIFGILKYVRWYFIIHQDITYEDYFSVTEASTGSAISRFCYPDVDSALKSALEIVQNRRYYFETSTRNILVKHQKNLTARNVSTDLAINTLLLCS